MTKPRTPPGTTLAIETVPFFTEAEAQNIVSMYCAGWTVPELVVARERTAPEIRFLLRARGVLPK